MRILYPINATVCTFISVTGSVIQRDREEQIYYHARVLYSPCRDCNLTIRWCKVLDSEVPNFKHENVRDIECTRQTHDIACVTVTSPVGLSDEREVFASSFRTDKTHCSPNRDQRVILPQDSSDSRQVVLAKIRKSYFD